MEQVQQYFRQFSFFVSVEENEDHSKAFIYYPAANDSVDYAIVTRLHISNDIVDAIVLDLEAVMWGGFSPHRMINEYGKPDQILFSRNGEKAMNLVFLYSNKHIYVEYLFLIEENANEKKACFGGFNLLETWFTEMPRQYTPLYPIEDATQMKLESLYETFKDPSTKYCFPVR